jgi:hypothetical protein
MNALDRDSLGQLFELVLGNVAERPCAVGSDNAGSGQLELPLQLAVVGEQQQAFGHEVEAADWHYAWKAWRQAVVDSRPAPGIALSGNRSLRLVKSEQTGGGCGWTGFRRPVTP